MIRRNIMFYLRIENQIHLILILLFSSYIYLSSLALKLEPFLKNLGTAFFIPLVLGIISFMTVNTVLNESYLFFSEFFLVTALLIVLAFKNSKDFNTVIYILLYAFPLMVIFLNLNFDTLHKHIIFNILLYIYLGIILLVIILSVIKQNYSLMVLHAGLFSLCASLVLPIISSLNIAVTVAMLFKAASYLLISVFFHKSAIGRMEEDYRRTAKELARITDNIQREVNRRLARIEDSNIPLHELSKVDNLTETYTEKAILNYIEYLIEKDPNGEFSVLLTDIASFNKINSKLGNIAGEKCIKALSDILKNISGKDCKTGRFDESGFIVVMPDTNVARAWLVAERIAKEAEKTNDPHFEVITGVVSYPLDADNVKDLIKAAKKTLRASKKSGK